jgi:hypothetical protein
MGRSLRAVGSSGSAHSRTSDLPNTKPGGSLSIFAAPSPVIPLANNFHLIPKEESQRAAYRAWTNNCMIFASKVVCPAEALSAN